MSSIESTVALAGHAVGALLGRLAEAIDGLQALPLAGMPEETVLVVTRAVEVARRRLPTLDHALVAELDTRSTAATRRHRGTASLLTELLHIDASDARARVQAAAELGPRTSITGDVLAPLHPATATAQAAGAISDRHAAVITRAVRNLPHGLDPEVVAAAERTLAAHATHLPPAQLARAAERLTAHLDPDGRLTDDTDRARRRGLTIGPQGADGMSPVRGLLDPTCRALVDAAFSALARPSPDGPNLDRATPDPDGPDPRSPGQRHHDALAALCRLALACGELPTNRGLPATVVLTMSLAQLEAAIAAATATPGAPTGTTPRVVPNPDGATARTATGTRLPIPDALRLATDAHWVLALFDRGGQPLYLSRSTRLATPAQRLALIARDRGCTRPGCDLPAGYTQVHHLDSWQHDGRTDIDNLALVCDFDHHLITEEGFTVAMGPRGRVEWTAPRRLDPERRPRVNPLHHPPDLTDRGPPAAA